MKEKERKIKIMLRKKLLELHRGVVEDRKKILENHTYSCSKLKDYIKFRKKVSKFTNHLLIFLVYLRCNFKDLFYYIWNRKSYIKSEIDIYWSEKRLIKDMNKMIDKSNYFLKTNTSLINDRNFF